MDEKGFAFWTKAEKLRGVRVYVSAVATQVLQEDWTMIVCWGVRLFQIYIQENPQGAEFHLSWACFLTALLSRNLWT